MRRIKRYRQFAGASQDRLTQELSNTLTTINKDLQASLKTLRARSRELTQNNPYARKFLQMVKANVVGANGIKFQSLANSRQARERIETAFSKWSGKNCSMSGRLNYIDIQRLAIESVARDGEVFIQIVNTGDNFKLHVFEADLIDVDLNETRNNTKIRMGVEIDDWDKPIAYYVRTKHPNDLDYNYSQQTHKRIPAENIIHLYITERAGQLRGVPWLHASLRHLSMLGGFEEASLVNARVGASKMGFYITPDGDSYVGEEDETGAKIQEAEPAVFEELPAGTTFQEFNPQYPSGEFDPFTKRVLRSVSSGLNVAYNSLANDLEGVNFSSIRSGVLEEREQWKVIQNWLIENFNNRIADLFLEKNDFVGRNTDKYKHQARGFSWVDPLKDMQASQLGIQLGVITRQEIAASQGKDFEDVLAQLQIEKELLEKYGVSINGQAEDTSGNITQNDNDKSE